MIACTQYTIVDLNDPIQQGSVPSDPAEGMLWLDTSSSPPLLKRYNGSVWQDVGDSGAGAEALEIAQDALVTSTENAANIAAMKTQITMSVSSTDYAADQQIVEQRMTQIEQTASAFKVEVTKTVTDQTAAVAGNVQGVRQDLSQFQSTVQGYMAFDGDQLTLGKTGNSFKTQITNTEMAFTENNEKVAYISNSDMYITRARVTDTLSVGTVSNGYFDFVTMPGGLALKWRNGS